MTKLIHKGKEYETGRYYYFHNGCVSNGYIYPLRVVTDDGVGPFLAGGGCWAYCVEISPDDLGKITKQPIELEDGEVYRFKLKQVPFNSYLVGVYDKTNDWLDLGDSRVWLKDSCEDFVKLVPEVK